MKQLDRRQWLRTAGITGALTLFGGLNGISRTTLPEAKTILNDPNNLIKLSSNENPFGPSEKVRQAMIEAFDLGCRYPYTYNAGLVEMLAEKEGVSPDNIVLVAGSTEGLRITGLAYGWQGGNIIAADPTFQSMLRYSEQFGVHIHRVPLDDDLQHDLEAMERRITTNTRLIFVCNPNNPTGTLLPPDRFRDFCESASKKTIVFSDEAYFDYIEEPNYPSMVELVKKDMNVVVSRTFSKVYGLAGIRVGYLIARPDIAKRLSSKKVAMTNVLAIHAAKTALKDKEFYQLSLAKNAESRNMIYQTLDDLSLPYKRSHTNFVFFKSGKEIAELIPTFREQGIMIGRPFPPLTKWCRISTGTMEATEAFCSVLRKVMA